MKTLRSTGCHSKFKKYFFFLPDRLKKGLRNNLILTEDLNLIGNLSLGCVSWISFDISISVSQTSGFASVFFFVTNCEQLWAVLNNCLNSCLNSCLSRYLFYLPDRLKKGPRNNLSLTEDLSLTGNLSLGCVSCISFDISISVSRTPNGLRAFR